MPPPDAVLPGPAVRVPLPLIVIVLPLGAIAVSDGVVAPTTQMYVAWLPFALLAAASPLTPSSSPSASNANTNGRLIPHLLFDRSAVEAIPVEASLPPRLSPLLAGKSVLLDPRGVNHDFHIKPLVRGLRVLRFESRNGFAPPLSRGDTR